MHRQRLNLAALLLVLASATPDLARGAGDPGRFRDLNTALAHAGEVHTLILKGGVPREVDRLPNLRSLEAEGPLPEQPLRLPHLLTLALSGKQVIKIPDCIGTLTTLQSLDLSYTKVTTLPRTIGQLVNLQELVMTNTPLESLPAEIANLKKVRVLGISDTHQLKRLPLGIGGMDNLETLDARYTGLDRRW